MNTKDNFHKLIDAIKDEEMLKAFYDLVHRLNDQQTGDLWRNLSKEEQEELLSSYSDSFYPENLISHSLVKDQHKKWLKK